ELEDCTSTPFASCSTSFRVQYSGQEYRYTLKTGSGANATFATAEVLVPALTDPAIIQQERRVPMDMFNVQPQTLSWTHLGNGHVMIKKGFGIVASDLPATGSY